MGYLCADIVSVPVAALRASGFPHSGYGYYIWLASMALLAWLGYHGATE